VKVVIAGSRGITDMSMVETAIEESGFQIDEVVCGGAKGVDSLGARWAKANGIPVKWFPAQWHRYGKRAGMERNIDMARYADALIAVWDGKSIGTAHMLRIAPLHALKVYRKDVPASSTEKPIGAENDTRQSRAPGD